MGLGTYTAPVDLTDTEVIDLTDTAVVDLTGPSTRLSTRAYTAAKRKAEPSEHQVRARPTFFPNAPPELAARLHDPYKVPGEQTPDNV